MKKTLLIICCCIYGMVSGQNDTELLVLGIAQDGGSPHINCYKECCTLLRAEGRKNQVVSLGLQLHDEKKTYLFEATPDLPNQMATLTKNNGYSLEGIFLTHAHIGHYTGLQFLGREAMGAKEQTVYALPKMNDYLTHNGPWSQLVALKNILLQPISFERKVALENEITVTAIQVVHRDEFSETAAYRIETKNKKALFIPDIDKWHLWEKSIVDEIDKVDYAFIDASFFDQNEISYRAISEIPHPFVIESLALFKSQPKAFKDKVYFIHFNHTNPLLDVNSSAYKAVIEQGYHIAREGMRLKM